MSIPLTLFHPMDPRGRKVGGAEQFLRGLIRHAPEDFDIQWVGLSAQPGDLKEEVLSESGRRFRFIPLLRIADENRRSLIPLSLRYTLALRPCRRRFHDRVLFFNRIEPFWLFRKSAAPSVIAVHNDIRQQIESGRSEVLWSRFPRLYDAFEKHCLPSASAVISESRNSLERHAARFPNTADRLQWIPTWYDPLRFHLPDDRPAMRSQLAAQEPKLDPAKKWILFTGRFQPQKAPMRLLETFALIRKQHPDSQLILHGDGNMLASLQKQTAALGLQASVILPDPDSRASVSTFLQAADVFLLASDYEGMPLSILEALACGLPVVSTPVGEMPRLVTPGLTGELAAECTAGSLAEVLSTVLENPGNYPPESCASSVREFTPERSLAPLYSLFRELGKPLPPLR